jgi:hypothetical protein
MRSMSVRVAVIVVLCGAGGCATPPVDPIIERVDASTTTTVVRLGAPAELVATRPRPRGEDPFAWLGPFETNRMGTRAQWLWVAWPPAGDSVPAAHIDCGGSRTPVPAASVSIAELTLSALPYSAPAPWSVVRVLPLDADLLACLASDAGAALVTSGAEVVQYAADTDRRADFAAFAERTGSTRPAR